MPKGTILSRRDFLRTAAMTIASAQLGAIASAKTRSALSALDRASTWLNSQPLPAEALQGKVVLVEFWTYTCINWRRQLPYVRAWAEKYKNQGLIVIGVHSPECSFEKNIEYVRWAAKDMRGDFPIAVDNDHAVWAGFNNEYWPALYFVDAKGKIRHTRFGEGEYDQSERVIQKLLSEAGAADVRNELVSIDPSGPEAQPDWKHLQSAENYLGYVRTENFASNPVQDKARVYSAPKRIDLNYWALSGDWTMGKEAIRSNQPNARVVYRFHGRDLHLVAGPAVPGTSVRFRALIDGNVPGSAHGVDVDEQGSGRLVEHRMYQLIRQPGQIVDRQFEIEFLDSSAEAFSFTFG